VCITVRGFVSRLPSTLEHLEHDLALKTLHNNKREKPLGHHRSCPSLVPRHFLLILISQSRKAYRVTSGVEDRGLAHQGV
jgi:hypothetical protein